MGEGAEEPRSAERLLSRVFVAVLVLAAVARVLAVFTENVNWDEMALLERGDNLLRTGVLSGGGRPGLATLVVAPFAEGCRNAVDALVQARVLWTGFVAAAALAFGLLLRGVLPETRTRTLAVLTGVALWVLAPAFLRYSVHVRTDQLAILGGLWGGVLLLASLKRPWLAAVAGVAMAAGFLASQKLVYVTGPVLTLVGVWHLVHGEVRWRREVARAGLLALGFALTVVAFDALAFRPEAASSTLVPVTGQLRTFDFYRERSGFLFYLWMLPTLVGQLIAVAHLLPASVAWLKDSPRRNGGLLLGAWVVLLGTVVVVAFHAGRFPYFYMVVGLFPATIGALVVGWMLAWFRDARGRVALLALIWVPLTWSGLREARAMIRDDLSHQRTALAFVNEAFPPEARGFEATQAFVCRHDPDPFPTRFGEHVLRDFGGPDGEARAREMMDEFRTRPVSFMIRPTDPNYPASLQDFWDTHYVRYSGAVEIPGRFVGMGEVVEQGVDFEPVVAGAYRWWPETAGEVLLVDGEPLAPGETVKLPAAGTVTLRPVRTGGGLFALDVGRPPAPSREPFYTLFLERRDRSGP